VFFLDRMLIGSLRFVFDKLAQVADQELNDTSTLKDRLLDAQMRFELGELSEDEFVQLQEDVMARLREIEQRKRDQQADDDGEGGPAGETKITGVDISFDGDEHDDPLKPR
jgi:hypothetical protein